MSGKLEERGETAKSAMGSSRYSAKKTVSVWERFNGGGLEVSSKLRLCIARRMSSVSSADSDGSLLLTGLLGTDWCTRLIEKNKRMVVNCTSITTLSLVSSSWSLWPSVTNHQSISASTLRPAVSEPDERRGVCLVVELDVEYGEDLTAGVERVRRRDGIVNGKELWEELKFIYMGDYIIHQGTLMPDSYQIVFQVLLSFTRKIRPSWRPWSSRLRLIVIQSHRRTQVKSVYFLPLQVDSHGDSTDHRLLFLFLLSTRSRSMQSPFSSFICHVKDA